MTDIHDHSFLAYNLLKKLVVDKWNKWVKAIENSRFKRAELKMEAWQIILLGVFLT